VPAKHWSPTVGVRLWDALAFITDTAFDEATIGFARGVNNLLHEAWSTSADPIAAEGDATGSDAGRIAAAAAAQQLTLIHLNPRLPDHTVVSDDAQVHTPSARLGADRMLLQLWLSLPHVDEH
jgi:ribonuclease BN (tRNA processing enzyme)